MKVEIKAYHAVAAWKWDLPEDADDTCGICRVNFEGTCAKCKYPGADCPIIIGQCTHCFHMHCIGNWLESEASLGKCPMCRQKFQEKMAAPVTPAPVMPARTDAAAMTPQIDSSFVDQSARAPTRMQPLRSTPGTGSRNR